MSPYLPATADDVAAGQTHADGGWKPWEVQQAVKGRPPSPMPPWRQLALICFGGSDADLAVPDLAVDDVDEVF